jgi:hypothetical protein
MSTTVINNFINSKYLQLPQILILNNYFYTLLSMILENMSDSG